MSFNLEMSYNSIAEYVRFDVDEQVEKIIEEEISLFDAIPIMYIAKKLEFPVVDATYIYSYIRNELYYALELH